MDDLHKVLGEAARDEILRQRVNADQFPLLYNVIPPINWTAVGLAVSLAAIEVEVKALQNQRRLLDSIDKALGME